MEIIGFSVMDSIGLPLLFFLQGYNPSYFGKIINIKKTIEPCPIENVMI